MRTYVTIVLLLGGSYWYVTHKVKLDEPLAYAAKHKKASWSPAANYYIGLAYYQRSDYGKAQDAFRQLLNDHTTSHYVEKGLPYFADAAEFTNDWDTVKEVTLLYTEQYPEGKQIERMRKKLEIARYKRGP